MKLIHLSDLHIGKRVNEISMIEDQEFILHQILQIIDDEKADALLIAGDVYDKSVPSASDTVEVTALALSGSATALSTAFAPATFVPVHQSVSYPRTVSPAATRHDWAASTAIVSSAQQVSTSSAKRDVAASNDPAHANVKEKIIFMAI